MFNCLSNSGLCTLYQFIRLIDSQIGRQTWPNRPPNVVNDRVRFSLEIFPAISSFNNNKLFSFSQFLNPKNETKTKDTCTKVGEGFYCYENLLNCIFQKSGRILVVFYTCLICTNMLIYLLICTA